MNELDDFLCEQQSDEFEEEFWDNHLDWLEETW
jgi:hypothetical protein